MYLPQPWLGAFLVGALHFELLGTLFKYYKILTTIWRTGPTLPAVALGVAVNGVGVQPAFLLVAIVLALSVFVSFNKSNKQLDATRELASL